VAAGITEQSRIGVALVFATAFYFLYLEILYAGWI